MITNRMKTEMEQIVANTMVVSLSVEQNPIPTQYTLHNCILESVSSAKYLGVDISSDLSWDTHINRISKKADIKIHPESLKSSAYKVLVRPQLRVLLHSLVSIHRFKYL